MTGVSPLDASGLLAALSDAGVDFVVIGGFAVSAHGYPRATKDLDIVPAPDAENLERLAAVLRFCSYEHLVTMKEAASRPEDLLDLKRLRQARGE